jgi:glycyl-tRNA synthetase beta chain
MQPEKPEIIARNSERVLTARLRDARFFWDEDRSSPLESKLDRLSTILFHKKLGSYREKADRVSQLAAMIARDALQRPEAVPDAEQAGRLCKADLATDIVRELTELQGTMGGIYAREDGLPETGLEGHLLPLPAGGRGGRRAADPQAAGRRGGDVGGGVAGLTSSTRWWACSRRASGRPGLAIPSGCGARRRGWCVSWWICRADRARDPGHLKALVDRAGTPWQPSSEVRQALDTFLTERIHFLFEQRGFDIRAVRAVVKAGLDVDLVQVREKLEALVQLAGSAELQGVAALFKRVKNITKDVARGGDIPPAC